jgi:hypothetical protein
MDRRPHPSIWSTCAATLALACGGLVGGRPAAAAPSPPRPRIEATLAAAEIRVDGVLDEADWARAAPITGFRRILTSEGAAPTDSTDARVVLGERALYLGIRCYAAPGRVRASLAPRDQILDGDQIAVHLDTYRDFRRAYLFGVNPWGVQMDGILVGEEPDLTWDAVWDSEVRRDADGWTAEIAVPLRTLRFPERGPGVWGLWIRRESTRDDEISSWPPYRLEVTGDIMLQAADLAGLESARGAGRIDLQPYAASAWSRDRWAEPETGFGPWSDSRQSDVGLDLRAPVSTDLVLTAAANPDFSQIEADALQIDLNQRYPLFYDEKRPFFLEGAEIFDTPFDLVYTRRIADPSLGARLVGNEGRLRLGLLVARDDGGGSRSGVGSGNDAGPTAEGTFWIGRASLDLGEQSSVGLLATGHQTDSPDPFGGSDGVARLGAAGNLVLAADARLRLSPRWTLTGQWLGTRTHADTVELGIDTLTLGFASSERRGARHGNGWTSSLAYTDGVRSLEVSHQWLDPDVRVETGFLPRVDMRESAIESSFFVRPENAWLRSLQPIFDGYVIHDHTGALQEWWVSPMIDWVLERNTHVHTMWERSREHWRGRDHERRTWTLIADNSWWRPLAVSAGLEVGDGIWYGASDAESFLGWLEEYEFEATVRPSPRLTAECVAERTRFTARGRGTLFDVWTLGAKTTVQFTRRLYVRFYPQFDTGSEHLDLDALAGYVVHPGSVVYLGVNGGFDGQLGVTRDTRRALFLKVSYRFGI